MPPGSDGSTLEMFGAHETAPAARFDCMGWRSLLDRGEVVSIDRDGADIVTVTGARQRFRRRPLPAGNGTAVGAGPAMTTLDTTDARRCWPGAGSSAAYAEDKIEKRANTKTDIS